MSRYKQILDYLIANPDESLISVGKRFNCNPCRFKRNIIKEFGYDFDAHLAAQEKRFEDNLLAQWPELFRRLEETDENYKSIAADLGLSEACARKLIAAQRYDLKKRFVRIRSNDKRPRPQTIKADASLLPLVHSLPLKELWRAVA